MQGREKSPFVFALFIALLLIAAGSAVYALLHPGPWIVPEEAKRVVNPLKPSQADLPGARARYLDKCAECHGDTGKGDGSQAKLYDPKPSNLTDAAHMPQISDGEIFLQAQRRASADAELQETLHGRAALADGAVPPVPSLHRQPKPLRESRVDIEGQVAFVHAST
jgi:mono/diheme cytochrome c family protein